MHCTRKLTNSVSWVGGSDRRLALFENLFPIPRGVSYNSYVILDEQDSPGRHGRFLHYPASFLKISKPFWAAGRWIISSSTIWSRTIAPILHELLLRYPNLKIVGNPKTFPMIQQFSHRWI